MTKFVPTHNFCALESEKAEKIGSILLPDTAKAKFSKAKGKLLKCGPTVSESIKALIGKEVWYGKFSGDTLEITKDDIVFICTDEDIVGHIEE